MWDRLPACHRHSSGKVTRNLTLSDLQFRSAMLQGLLSEFPVFVRSADMVMEFADRGHLR